MKVVVTGIPQLDAKFKEMGLSMAKKAMRRGTREVAKVSLQMAKATAPKRSGLLARSLKVVAKPRSRRQDQQFVVGARVQTKEGFFKGKTFYAGFLELGTRQRFAKSTNPPAGRGFISRAKFAFLKKANDAFQGRKRGIYIRAIGDWIREQASKPAKKPKVPTA